MKKTDEEEMLLEEEKERRDSALAALILAGCTRSTLQLNPFCLTYNHPY